ncbi:P-loop containing nucleoside triphosphate hydrolase protein [Myxozyma melibiosi]|uniref:P-loop containing nucleoside triphosphate hydrolase protein n=1 Tax=Myxozyma melibiosi TaxID=54550 RepID=A0ABR1FDS1_9ASCO
MVADPQQIRPPVMYPVWPVGPYGMPLPPDGRHMEVPAHFPPPQMMPQWKPEDISKLATNGNALASDGRNGLPPFPASPQFPNAMQPPRFAMPIPPAPTNARPPPPYPERYLADPKAAYSLLLQSQLAVLQQAEAAYAQNPNPETMAELKYITAVHNNMLAGLKATQMTQPDLQKPQASPKTQTVQQSPTFQPPQQFLLQQQQQQQQQQQHQQLPQPQPQRPTVNPPPGLTIPNGDAPQFFQQHTPNGSQATASPLMTADTLTMTSVSPATSQPHQKENKITNDVNHTANGRQGDSSPELSQAMSTTSSSRKRIVIPGITDRRLSDDSEDDWRPDVYASSFIPLWLKNVNTYVAVETVSTKPPDFNLQEYVSGFVGNKILKHEPVPPFQYQKSGNGKAIRHLSVDTYRDYFFDLIDLEINAQKKELARYDMYAVSLEESDRERSLFKLKCPGIKEFTPTVEIGNLLYFRQLRPQFSTQGPDAFSGFKYPGYIWHFDRGRGEVLVRIDGLMFESNLFNVQFEYDETFLSVCAHSIDVFQKKIKEQPDGFVRRMLFPKDEDGTLQTTLPQGTFNLDWYDKGLNFEQQRAIDSVVKRNYGDVPFLISGPPGTGKTKTIVELALQLLKADKRKNVLLCAPSDAAADTLALRLRHYLNNKELFRLNHFTRPFAEVPSELLPFCAIDYVDLQDMFVFPEFEALMNYRIVVCSCKDSEILMEAQCSNRALKKYESFVYKSFRMPEPSDRLHWNALLVDEAGQGTEPETVIPLQVVMPDEDYAGELPMFVMAGDHKQLGPRTASRQEDRSELDVSLFERLMERAFYAEHPLARKQQLRSRKQPALPYLRPAFANLVRNYRSHPAILAMPSSLFYYDTLLPEATNVDSLCEWPRLPNRNLPVMFINNTGDDEMIEDGVSWYNTEEINLCCELVQDIITKGLVRPHEIAIAVPFREQIRRIRLSLRRKRLSEVNVGPIESYQGAEHRVVVVCTTRTRERFIERDFNKGLGLIHESKRFNVAITRAKELLVLIGNAEILQRDENWRALMSYCFRNSLFDHRNYPEWRPSQDEVNTPLFFSKIERGIAFKKQAESGESLKGYADDDAMWLAGFTAEEVLDE